MNSKSKLIQFLKNSRDWETAIPLLDALEDNDKDTFNDWLQNGSTIKLFNMCHALSSEVIKNLYENRHDILPYNNDMFILDTSRCYLVDRGLVHVDQQKQYDVYYTSRTLDL